MLAQQAHDLFNDVRVQLLIGCGGHAYSWKMPIQRLLMGGLVLLPPADLKHPIATCILQVHLTLTGCSAVLIHVTWEGHLYPIV